MMTHRPGILRRFRFNLPQRIAAGLLAAFLVQGLWLTCHQTMTDRDYQYARCGREMWERPSQLAGYFTSCGNIHDGILAYRLAGLPLTLNLLAERGLDHFRKPEDRVVQTGGEQSAATLSTWELRHQLTHILFLLRLPFLGAGCLLGGGLWWVTRRLYGNLGGYMALALYCFSPAVLRACVTPNAEVLASLGVYGGVYTCIGVAHAMQGPRRKWRPRIVLLTVAFGVAAASHIAALIVVVLLGLAAMLWVAEGRRSQTLPVVADGYGRGAGGGLCVLRLLSGCFQLSFPLGGGFSVGFARSGRAVLLHTGQRRDHSGLWRRRGAVSGAAQVMVFRQYSAVALRPGLDGAGDDRRSGESMAVGGAVSAYVCGRSLRRRLRRAKGPSGSGRRWSHCAAAGSLLRAEFAGAGVEENFQHAWAGFPGQAIGN
jgi:hypothetical protein